MSTPATVQTAAATDIPGLIIPPRKLDARWHLWLLRIVARLMLGLFGWYFPMRIVGIEQIPAEGPLLVVANHLSVMDIPTVGAILVQRGCIRASICLRLPNKNCFTNVSLALWRR